jgi:hypothetical protein
MTPHPSGRRLIPEGGATAEAVARRLHDSPYLALKTIHWEYREGVLTLTGHLPSYYLKQRAQALFTDIEGIRRIDNRIEVGVGAPEVLPPLGSPKGGDAPARLARHFSIVK